MSSAHHEHSPLTWLGSDRMLARRVARPTARFLRIEAAGGMLMILGTIIALIWGNVAAASYIEFWHTPVIVDAGAFHLDLSLHDWVNDGLMALFFFVVGMEIKREMVKGELRDPKAAALPIIAAIGGMVVPALIYMAFNYGGVGAKGWGIPMATDIAFAVGIVSLLGPRVPAQLKLFLLTLAVTDDLGGIAVIAIFYADGVSLWWLAASALVMVGMYLLRRGGVWYFPIYVALGVFAWYCMYRSGVHPTVAGVVIGFLTPTTPLRPDLDAEEIAESLENRDALTATDVRQANFLIKETVPVNERLTDLLHPWTGFVIIPIFALANASIPLNSEALSAAATSPITWGVALGLLLGKLIGVSAASFIAIKLGVGRMPRGGTWLHIVGVSLAAGIGFTVAIFVTGISFADPLLQNASKVGIFVASIAAAVLALLVLRAAANKVGSDELEREAEENKKLFAESPTIVPSA